MKYEENKETRQVHRDGKRNERSKRGVRIDKTPDTLQKNPLTEAVKSVCLKGILSPLQIL